MQGWDDHPQVKSIIEESVGADGFGLPGLQEASIADAGLGTCGLRFMFWISFMHVELLEPSTIGPTKHLGLVVQGVSQSVSDYMLTREDGQLFSLTMKTIYCIVSL